MKTFLLVYMIFVLQVLQTLLVCQNENKIKVYVIEILGEFVWLLFSIIKFWSKRMTKEEKISKQPVRR